MRRLFLLAMVLSSSALAQNSKATEPVCEPIGRTSKGDLVYSMQCRNIPGLPAGDKGYNPAPGAAGTKAPAPTPPASK
jgi:hypothetical protein